MDPELAKVAGVCLAKDPADRATAAELAGTAGQHAEPGPPTWSAIAAGRIAVRRASATGPARVTM